MLSVDSVHQTFPPPRSVQRLLIRGASDEPVPVLHGIDVRVERGEVVGLIGPNGAGKTTLIKIISALLDQTSGHVTVDGFDTLDDPMAVRRRLGLVLADDRSVYWRMTGRQNLEFFGAMHGLSATEAQRRTAEMMERLELAHRDKLVFGYSTGMRARLCIARALLHEPPLLVLDEPTKALDPVATAEVGELVRQLAADGAAVLLSSHRLDEIEAVCDRIVVMMSGRITFSGTVAELAGDRSFVGALHELLSADEHGSDAP
jgi:ABC-2 type transport system ATP-binding protein